jgi:hypothetical protein
MILTDAQKPPNDFLFEFEYQIESQHEGTARLIGGTFGKYLVIREGTIIRVYKQK